MRIHRSKTPIRCGYENCEKPPTTARYCRLHYIAQSQKKYRKLLLSKEKMLDNYVKAITKRYPDKYLEVIKKDLSNEDSFKKTIHDLEIHGDFDLGSFDEDDVLEKFKKK